MKYFTSNYFRKIQKTAKLRSQTKQKFQNSPHLQYKHMFKTSLKYFISFRYLHQDLVYSGKSGSFSSKKQQIFWLFIDFYSKIHQNLRSFEKQYSKTHQFFYGRCLRTQKPDADFPHRVPKYTRSFSNSVTYSSGCEDVLQSAAGGQVLPGDSRSNTRRKYGEILRRSLRMPYREQWPLFLL